MNTLYFTAQEIAVMLGVSRGQGKPASLILLAIALSCRYLISPLNIFSMKVK